MSTYSNGPGNIPRLPDRVVDTLIDSAGVSRCAPGATAITVRDQTAEVERLVHDACEELLARLPAAPVAPPGAQEVHFFRQKDSGQQWCEISAEHLKIVQRGPSADVFEYRTLYTAPVPATTPAGADPEGKFAQGMLVELARMGASPAGLSLAAQLFGVGPCEGCGYRKLYCRCATATNTNQPENLGAANTNKGGDLEN